MNKLLLLVLVIITVSITFNEILAAPSTNHVRGRILLQVESRGEAWYVNPADDRRYYMKDGSTAYEMMRSFGLGITTVDLEKIPVGFEDRFEDIDTDGDGLSDKIEEAPGGEIEGIDGDPNSEQFDKDFSQTLDAVKKDAGADRNKLVRLIERVKLIFGDVSEDEYLPD